MCRRTKINITLWAFYDFANSLVWIGFLFYFPQWLVIDQGQPAWWYNVSLIASSALFLCTAPFISSAIDRTGSKIGGLRAWTLFSFCMFLLTACTAIVSDSADVLAVILFIIGSYAYLVCFLYFTPMLNDLSTGVNRARVSGIGQGANLLGQGLILAITFPFTTGTLLIFGGYGYAEALLPATILFLMFALPLLFFYKEDSADYTPPHKHQHLSLFSRYKNILLYRPLALFLLAYFLFSDAVLTFSSNFTLYLDVVHNASDATKTFLAIGILGLAAIGSVLFGYIANARGELRTLKFIIASWCGIFLLMAFITNLTYLLPIFLIAGIIYGPTFGISRALIGKFAAKGAVATTFSFYVIAERFSTFIGPALWSAVLLYKGEGVVGYQAALVTMAVVMMLSFLVLYHMHATHTIR